jgi:hypothetical protein
MLVAFRRPPLTAASCKASRQRLFARRIGTYAGTRRMSPAFNWPPPTTAKLQAIETEAFYPPHPELCRNQPDVARVQLTAADHGKLSAV